MKKTELNSLELIECELSYVYMRFAFGEIGAKTLEKRIKKIKEKAQELHRKEIIRAQVYAHSKCLEDAVIVKKGAKISIESPLTKAFIDNYYNENF
jgi:hypothetical protein